MSYNSSGEGKKKEQQLLQALVNYLKEQGLLPTARVEEAFRAVPRHLFLPGVDIEKVYSDTYISTKQQDGRSISSSSQPAIMAAMLEALDLHPGQRVLEIGAGTGYNAALMAHIVGEQGSVTTIDIDEDIVMAARQHLETARYNAVQVILADGGFGYAENAPYDRIILTVSADDIVAAWREQLKQGGRLVLPFKLTQMRQNFYLQNIAATGDQIVLTLQKTDERLESVEMRMCGFMFLRGAFAVNNGEILCLEADCRLSLTAKNIKDAHDIAHILADTYQDHTIPIKLTYQDIWSLRMWLALQDDDYCEIYGQGDKRGHGHIPSLAKMADNAVSTLGLYQRESISLLMRSPDEESTAPNYWQTAFDLSIRSFGRDNTQAEHLLKYIRLWETAGRPFRWSADGLIYGIKIYVYPLNYQHKLSSNEKMMSRSEAQFVLQWS